MSEAAILRDLAGVQSRLLFPHAVALARMGRYAEAEQCVRVLFEHAPSADACCLLGRMFGQQARYDDAAAAFEQALTIEPGHPEAGVALECVRARARPGSAASLRTWRLIGATAVMIVIAAVATFVRVTPQGRVTSSASNAAVAPAARDADGVNPDVAGLMQAFGALTAALQPFRSVTDVSLHPVVARGPVVVAVRGTVPSAYLRDEITRVLGSHAGSLKIDTTAVRITGRYTVRTRDTFSSIAAALCGRASRFTALQADNPDAIPDRLKPGSPVVVACE